MLANGIEYKIAALNNGPVPAIDLSDAELFEQAWPNINFSWINTYMDGVDLRGALLNGSRWSTHDYLAHAHLQCAQLINANFQGANLLGADLGGAYVQGADFRGAQLGGAKLVVYGVAKWSAADQKNVTSLPVPVGQSTAACLQNRQFRDTSKQ